MSTVCEENEKLRNKEDEMRRYNEIIKSAISESNGFHLCVPQNISALELRINENITSLEARIAALEEKISSNHN
jgi:hypothetical protein